MKSFQFLRPQDVAGVSASLGGDDAQLKANGIDLLDMMKERIAVPERVVSLIDVKGLDRVEVNDDGSILLGSMVTLHRLATDKTIASFLPSLRHAASAAASLQIRARATLGGNLGQHPRCGYFRHGSMPCLRRGGESCPARDEGGVHEGAGVFNNSSCASAHPSSLAPVLGSLDAVARVQGPEGTRNVEFGALWATPKKGVMNDLALKAGEWIASLTIPARAGKQSVAYEEVRQMAAFDWAQAACAVRLELGATKEAGVQTVDQARIWFGSLAPTPMRSEKAEEVLVTNGLSKTSIDAAADAAVKLATPLAGNGYKVKLARVVLKRALKKAGGVK